jgi:hypothetical protein
VICECRANGEHRCYLFNLPIDASVEVLASTIMARSSNGDCRPLAVIVAVEMNA